MTNRARTPTFTVGVRALFALVLSLAGCSHQQPADEVTPTRPAMAVRHDTAEIARIFPALGEPAAASWIRWDDGGQDSRATVTWIDAVVQVTPPTMTALLSHHQSEPSPHRPAVQKVLEAEVPAGPFRTGVELNMAFSPGRMSTRVFLDSPRDVVVLQSYDLS